MDFFYLSLIGPLASAGSRVANGFLQSTMISSTPDLWITISAYEISENQIPKRSLPETFRTYLEPYFGKDGVEIKISNLESKPDVTVRLRSRDPRDNTIIQTFYLSRNEDVERLADGKKLKRLKHLCCK